MRQRLNGSWPFPITAPECRRRARRALLLMLLASVPAVAAIAAGSFSTLSSSDEHSSSRAARQSAPPPFLLRPLSTSDAMALNRHIPFSGKPGPPAKSLVFTGTAEVRARALECLTSAVYYESASETAEGEAGVAQVILNRVRHPAFPASVCAVVYQGSTRATGCQFSYTCDGSLQRLPSRREWLRAQAIADAALAGYVYAPVGLATHYHTDQVLPYWAPTLSKSVQIGAHIFYRWAGGAGQAQGFTQRYSGKEDVPLNLLRIALIAHAIWPSYDAVTTKPRLALAIDPAAEVWGIMHILASDPGPSPSPFEKNVRVHLSSPQPISAHLLGVAGAAIAPAAALSAAPAALEAGAAFDQALGSGVAVKQAKPEPQVEVSDRGSRARRFVRTNRALYAAAMKNAQRLAETAPIDWATYAGDAVKSRTAVLSLSQGLESGMCFAPEASKTGPAVIRWPSSPSSLSQAEMFIASGFAEDSLSPPDGLSFRKAHQLRSAVEPIRAQIVAAVFARIAALSLGEASGQAIVKREVAQGHELVPFLVQRLRFFERNGDRFPSLNRFLLALVDGLPTRHVAAATDKPAEGAAGCSQPPLIAT